MVDFMTMYFGLKVFKCQWIFYKALYNKMAIMTFLLSHFHQSQDLRVVDQEYAQLSNPLCNRKNDSESILAYQISTIMAT